MSVTLKVAGEEGSSLLFKSISPNRTVNCRGGNLQMQHIPAAVVKAARNAEDLRSLLRVPSTMGCCQYVLGCD